MSAKSRIRAYVSISGQDRELLSILERRDGSLVLMFAQSDNAIAYGRFPLAYEEEHYSVHRTNGGNDTTFTQKTKWRDGGDLSVVAFLRDTRERLVWPLRSERMHYVTSFRKFEPKAKDKSIFITNYDQNSNTLYYSIMVTNRNYVIPDGKFDFLNEVAIETSYYKVIVSFSFLHLRVGFETHADRASLRIMSIAAAA